MLIDARGLAIWTTFALSADLTTDTIVAQHFKNVNCLWPYKKGNKDQ